MTSPTFSYDSLVLMTIVNLLTTGAVMMFIWNADRPGPGLIRMAWGDWLIGFGILLSAFISGVHGPKVVFVSELLIFGGAISLLSGVRAFRSFRPFPTVVLGAALAIYVVPSIYWLFIHSDMPFRIATSSVVLAVIYVALAVAMLLELPLEDRRLYVFSAILFSLHAISLALRAAWAIAHHAEGALHPGSPADFTVMMSLNFVTKGCCFVIAIASSRKLYHNTRTLALFDSLTQLPNRRMLDERIARLRNLDATRESGVGLIYLDLDDFKAINDTMGHQAGDEVLQVVSRRLQSRLGADAFPARLGGDEFVLLLEDVRSRSGAFAFMENVVQALESQMVVCGQSVSLTVSSGIALYPGDVTDISDLMRAADDSMYRAKRAPRQIAAFPRTQFKTYPSH